MSDVLKPSMQLLCKLGSIAVHAEEFLSSKGHHYDATALKTLFEDSEVRQWIKNMGPLMPVMKVYLAHWYDVKDRMYLIAGIYRTERAANKRLKQLDCGTTQTLTLGQPVRFTHEKPKRRAKRESEK